MCIYRQRQRRTGSCVLKSKALFYKLSSYVSCLYSNLHSGLFFNQNVLLFYSNTKSALSENQSSFEKFKQQLFLAQLPHISYWNICYLFYANLFLFSYEWHKFEPE